MIQVLVDTSILVEMSRTGRGCFLNLMELASQSSLRPLTSVMVVAEYWAGSSMNNPLKVDAGRILFEKLEIIETSPQIARLAGEIKRKHGTHIADAIIAATALENNAQLATLNTKHFENISGLRLWRGKK